ncbi:MAG: hypothetical protein WBV69_05525 [Candidatus Sulfotelmatobacter sp.]
MNVAVLFNADHPDLGGWCRASVMRRLLETKVLQSDDRNMRVSVGDILTFSAVSRSADRTYAHLVRVCRALYRPADLDLLIADRLEATHGKATVFCWLFQNMTSEIARALHTQLEPDPAYLGTMDVNFANPGQLALFRNSLVEEYRLRGTKCSVFYDMGENEDPDIAIREIFEQSGFQVDYEDAGARRTIFDNYDTLEHFTRVEDFKRVFSKFPDLSDSRTSDLAPTLEELHPKLFDAFASAARTLERAETEEDLAQAAISGRRLLERTADYLFPAQEQQRNGRDVGKAQYRNRLWAYLDEATSEAGISDPIVLRNLGNELDRLVKLFNAGLHANQSVEKVQRAFRDLVLWLVQVIEINPSHIRRPYLAYEDELTRFMRKAVNDKSES